MFSVRDIGLAEMLPEARRREAARVLLQKADLGPSGVALAVHELTGDRVLADVAMRIDMFRRLGMQSRVQDLVDEAADRRAAVLYGDAPRWRRLIQNAERALERPTRPRGEVLGNSRDKS
ncbi:MAG TPA: hypothetical protein VFY81_09070 [Gammaproteobacteria bacterium]|nr:hypothetical protein [Gammaproteobacteria bacterium]